MKTKIALITVLSLLSIHTTYAKDTVTIATENSVAGISTDVVLDGLDPNSFGQALILPPYGAELAISFEANDQGVGIVRIPGVELEQAGVYVVSILQDDQILEETGTFEVIAGSLDPTNSSMQADKNYIDSNGSDEVEVTVIARDEYNNPLQNRPMKLVSSRASDYIQQQSSETDDNGEQVFFVSSNETGTMTLRVLDLISGDVLPSDVEISVGKLEASSGGSPVIDRPLYRSARPQYMPQTYGSPLVGNILQGRKLYGQAVGFDVVDHFELEAKPQLEANLDENLTITAIDTNGNVVEDYVGTVLLSSTDPTAILPSFGEVTITESDLGSKKLVLGLRFTTPGDHLLYAEDMNNPSINGKTVVSVVGKNVDAEQTGKISMIRPSSNELVNTTDVLLEGKGPAFTNLIVTGGVSDAFGGTDLEGNFRIPVILDPNKRDHTLRVRSEDGKVDSGNLELTLDIVAPEVLNFEYTPSEPIEGDEVLVMIEIEEDGPELKQVELDIGDDTYQMTQTEDGKYQYVFPVPQPKNYKLVVTATDLAGNTSETRSSIRVSEKALPTVSKPSVKVKSNAVGLSWDPVDIEVDGYRIYVGEKKDEFLYTLDTDFDTTAATVGGLQPGETYYFAITALMDKKESPEKSEVVKASLVGLDLKIKERDGRLNLDWNSLGDSIPLSSYTLRYGVDEDNLSEERTINGDAESYKIYDLLNDVKYYVELTPIAVNGDVLKDLRETGDGTPNGKTDFTPTDSDPIPDDLELPGFVTGSGFPDKPSAPVIPGDPVPIAYNTKPPENTATGSAHTYIWILVSIGLVGVVLKSQRRRSLAAHQQFLASMEHKYNQNDRSNAIL